MQGAAAYVRAICGVGRLLVGKL